VFSKNRNPLNDNEVAAHFLDEVVVLAQKRDLMSDEHASVDGALLQAWASHKSFARRTSRRPVVAENAMTRRISV
jgi:transposase